MNIKNLNIGTQLKLGFATMLFFVVILGYVAYQQTNQIHNQTELMYDHPLKVRRALGELKTDIYSIQFNLQLITKAKTEQEKQSYIEKIDGLYANANEQFGILHSKYLGPAVDIDKLDNAFIEWKTINNSLNKLLLTKSNNNSKIVNNNITEENYLINKMLIALQKPDDYAAAKADQIYESSNELNNNLNRDLFIIVAIILLISLLSIYILLGNIRKPLNDLNSATRLFREGILSSRSSYNYKNEFGELSNSFNLLTESIQTNMELNEKTQKLASLMLSKYEAKEFFHETLNALAIQTGSQMAAVYLISDDKKSFEHFESIGVDENAKQSFSAKNFEGEFGIVLSSHKVQHIKNIKEDTLFVFNTVSGKFIPKEIITIPLMVNNNIFAIVSIASINKYSTQAIQLIHNIWVTLSARVEGILAYHKVKEFSALMEQQNHELETQKEELSIQSQELQMQNTELEFQKQQLHEANRLKTNFLSNMSHELRTPLNSVIALAGVLNKRLANKIPEEEYGYLEIIKRNGKNLLKLINDILDISRIEAGREDIEITKFNANSLIADVVGMINPHAKQKNIEIHHSTSDTEIFVSSDYDKCSHILQNILSNAIKFTEKGKVEISAKQNEKNIVISVSDTGIGISDENLHLIFEEFQQADSSTSRKFGGSGLGLAIAKKYANLLGGNISVKSTVGKGSEFRISLPLQFSIDNRSVEAETFVDFKAKTNQPSMKPNSGQKEKTILIIEDSEAAIIQIREILEESGYNIIVANDGANAIELLKNTIPDAIILDLMMPDIDGFKVLEAIRKVEQTANVPVLILTAKHITKEDLKFLKGNNIHQLIQKGDVNSEELLNVVASMVFTELPEKPRQLQSIKGKPVVLIVEDNADNMITAKAILSDGFVVLEAVDGITAFEMAKKHKPNLILMDIGLPDMDGIETFYKIRNNKHLQHIPVIALTASAMVNDREIVLAYGFDAYIAKPIDEQIFFKTINNTLYGK